MDNQTFTHKEIFDKLQNIICSCTFKPCKYGYDENKCIYKVSLNAQKSDLIINICTIGIQNHS